MLPRLLSIARPSGVPRADSLNVGIFGQLVHDVLVSGFSLHIQGIDVSIQIVFSFVLC